MGRRTRAAGAFSLTVLLFWAILGLTASPSRACDDSDPCRNAESALVPDAGDLILQATPYDLLRRRFRLELYAEMGHDCVNAGHRKNLVRAARKPLVPGHVILARADVRFAVIGPVTTTANCGDGLYVADPKKALRRELTATKGNTTEVDSVRPEGAAGDGAKEKSR
jgi:hypothetical protein